MLTDAESQRLLIRLVEALERIAPPFAPKTDLAAADAFVWHAKPEWLEPVPKVNYVDLSLLKGVEQQRALLFENTSRFAKRLPANNALLWGARGTGKSSLVKAVHAEINREAPGSLALVEIHREDIGSLPRVLTLVRGSDRRFLLFCDDLSFEGSDTDYKSLKAVLDGGVEGRPDNVLLYATSNRRHLMSREMIENERGSAIHASEATEEKVSLSDRFGLWLGFHNIDQQTFFSIIEGYARAFRLDVEMEDLHARATEWSVTRGSRSGRVAWQFIQDLAGQLGKPI